MNKALKVFFWILAIGAFCVSMCYIFGEVPDKDAIPPLKTNIVTTEEKMAQWAENAERSERISGKVTECSQYYYYLDCSSATEEQLDKWIAHAHNVTGK